ncbi:MAG TPA: twin-arginine translocase subunit TatC [Candidatus Krumholzibacteriaceae bacterium]|nr:twin-arginine translocase subunit TatC [Candidatus Krumholzibacteriaceae bacterium]
MLSDGEKNEKLVEMGLLDHLEELRSGLISVIAVWLGLSIILWFFSDRLIDFLLAGIPLESLYFNAPAEAFMTRMKLSFIVGFLLSFPYILFRIWAFVSPGLFSSEKKVVFPFIFPSTLLFYLGVCFAYWIMIPVVLDFLIKFGTDMLSPLISVGKYFNFVGRLCFTFGIVFQLPLAIIYLVISGVVSPWKLLRQWRWVVLTVFIVGAFLTPPDPVSQLLMALPLIALFFTSVALSIFIRKSGGKDR